MNPGGGSGREEPPLGIQIPDDARELDRDLLAYRREQRVQRRRSRLRRLTAPFGGAGTVLPLLASILAVCLVAGAMLSVATFGPSTTANKTHPSTAASSLQSVQSSPQTTAAGSGSPAATPGTSHGASATPTGATHTGATASGTTSPGTTATASGATASGAGTASVRPSGAANSPAGSPRPAPAGHAVASAAP